MKFLSGIEKNSAEKYMLQTAQVAEKATCERAKCGTIIVKNDKVIGAGYNSPPANDESQRKCHAEKHNYNEKVTDKTCCVHAEQRAIMDAMKNNPDKLKGSRLYFIRLDKNGEIAKAGKPYCTHCSKLALDAGISEFVLWHEEGICVYNTKEYNLLSFGYTQ